MNYLFAIIVILLACMAYMQYSFAKERQGYIKMIAAKDYVQYKVMEAGEKKSASEKKNVFTIREQREKPRVGD